MNITKQLDESQTGFNKRALEALKATPTLPDPKEPKSCKMCEVVKPLTEFRKPKSDWCNQCGAEYLKALQ